MLTIFHLVFVPAILTGAVSAALSYVLTRINGWLQLSAMPRPDRWHTKATPNSGGVAIFIAWAAAYLLFVGGGHGTIALGTTAIWLFGVIDDRVHLRPLPKLLAQTAVAIATVVAGAMRPLTPWPLLNAFIAVIWILAITNAFNLIDNMDGLCAGVTIIIAGTQAVVSAMNGYTLDARLFAIVGGAFAGFLALNYHPARIFMGDSGSMLAGFSLSALTLMSPLAHARLVAGGIFYPVMLFAYPLFDTALVSVLRRMCGRPVSQGGRDHSSHRLASIGLKERDVTWFLWGLTLLGAVAGLLMSMPLYAISAAVILVVFVSALAMFLATLPAYPLEITPTISRLSPWLPYITATLTLLADSCATGLALFFADITRYEGQIPKGELQQLLVAIPVVIVCHIAIAIMSRNVWPVNWTYFGLVDTFPIIRTASATAVLSYWILASWLHLVIPKGVVLVFAVLSIAFIIGIRSSLRVLRELLGSKVHGIRRIAIFGTGDFAAAVLSLLRTTRFVSGVPVMLLSDKEQNRRTVIGGVRVYPIRDGIERLQAQYHGSAILYPEGSGTAEERDVVRQMCRTAELEFLSVDLRVRAEGVERALHIHPVDKETRPEAEVRTISYLPNQANDSASSSIGLRQTGT
jgi:UDP-GlcNAc:undecaprenyl-phosphate/decaprenyl-phosphate GlcNAc-1-phosphate transferase